MLLYGKITVEVYDRDMYDALSYASTALWDGLAEKGFLPAITGQAVQLPDQLPEIDGDVWFGRSEGVVAGTFFVWGLEITFEGFKAMIAFQPDDEAWAPEMEGNWEEAGLIPDLRRLWCGVRFVVNRSDVYINLRLK